MFDVVPFGRKLLIRLPGVGDHGVTSVEYALMLALIAIAIVVTVTALGGALNGLFTTITNGI